MTSLFTRIVHTHDTEDNWSLKESFIPRAGEVVVYDADSKTPYERFKIGDGVTTLKNLPFTVERVVSALFNIQNNVIYADGGRITDYKVESTQ